MPTDSSAPVSSPAIAIATPDGLQTVLDPAALFDDMPAEVAAPLLSLSRAHRALLAGAKPGAILISTDPKREEHLAALNRGILRLTERL